MRKGMAVLLMNMLASELGYEVRWITDTPENSSDIILLDNNEGDSKRFSGTQKFEQAVEWLRQKM
ncbi:hypothetical protein KDW_46570 [Dictyobacter vulcani]|uniref:Uncharacterized protein n=1 Tax=Dictyobacter vulcani TaxID=2607529 RepID=A0A5J4KRG9_9CHLR|nr:hypothetical protein [Dictyobacter vulcani]GER90495.1 hypothetical protein KDW_46570 [Dictyobacter vulcani]